MSYQKGLNVLTCVFNSWGRKYIRQYVVIFVISDIDMALKLKTTSQGLDFTCIRRLREIVICLDSF